VTKKTIYQNEKSAQKIIAYNFRLLERLLVLVGKPFYITIFVISVVLVLSIKLIYTIIKFSLPLLIKIIFFLLSLFLEILKITTKLFISIVNLVPTIKIPKYKIKRPKVKITLKDTKKLIRMVTIIISLVLIVLIISSYFFWRNILYDLPSPEKLTDRKIPVSTKIYDRNNVLLYNIYKDENRSLVTLEEIPLHVRLATLAIEDAEFYQHPGFSVRGIIRAAIKNYKEGELTGGSTITQQLVKNTLLTPEKTLRRKLKEVVLSVMVEFTYSKDQILEMYLNEVSYGGTAYGIQEAARVYFGKDVNKLKLSEAALLAGLPKSPTKYSPYGANPETSKERQKEVLNLMKINGYITENQQIKAEEENIIFSPNRVNIKAPHFVMYIREILENRYSKEVVESGGLTVTTSLDYRIQKLAQEVVADEIVKLSNLNVGNGAALVINPKTGEVLAMVGSKDYFNTEQDGNVNVTLRPRQPGSSIKIVNYAYALSNKYTAASVLKDTPITYNVEGQKPYTPKNYDGKFRGHLTLRSAFAESRNVPAVKVLESYGVENMIDMGQKMGITTWIDPDNYGLSLTLGGGEVKLIDLAQAYSTIANYGSKVNINPILKVTNFEGKILEENNCSPSTIKSRFNIVNDVYQKNHNSIHPVNLVNSAHAQESCIGEQIIDPRVAFILIDILKDNTARTPAFGSNSLLNVPKHKEVAAKTGTSNNLRDNLAIGFNQEYLVAAWVGNNDNSEMSRVASGITGATPIFNKIMSAVLTQDSYEWSIPQNLVRLRVCKYTGTLPCKGCPTYFEWFLEEKTPTKSCNPKLIEAINKSLSNDPQGFILDEAASIEE
jgi:membrane peptidoglycan carboxypeptidase